MTENATENYPPKEFICTKSDAGVLLWMERSESKKVTDARAAAAAAKAVAEKAAADKAAAEKAAADAAAAQARADADAAAAKAQQDQAQARQVQPPAPSSVYYANCTAARAAGAAPIYRGQPGYRPALDRDNDGIACEK
ncbi:excalibur calcium-binding domain-containing protein [Arthrobacter sp. FW306-04-A]|uniref:excalibur calcium-binding domain-containing protein n=1 Tax=Arthrobacter sp. FW306-04-A TaxID=2879619 RepID=UPI0037BFF33F|nr:excalibur calcium-binding domain-containing protein [Arthrobacter sp. FW306-04-A]